MTQPSTVPGYKRTLHSFKVLWAGWECDEDGWVVEMKDGSRALILSSHMAPYVAEPSELVEKLAEYDKVVTDTNAALDLLRDSGGPLGTETV